MSYVGPRVTRGTKPRIIRTVPSALGAGGATRFPKLAGLGSCCASCAAGGPCSGGPHGGLGDTAAPAPPATLETMVADIRSAANRYVDQDAKFRKLQIAATLAIPAVAFITKAILHVRRGTPLL